MSTYFFVIFEVHYTILGYDVCYGKIHGSIIEVKK